MATITGATPLQPLPSWMSWVPLTVTVPGGGLSLSYSIVNLPLTYYGPSIPLGTGPWTYGGLTSPASTAASTSPTTSLQPSTTTSQVTSISSPSSSITSSPSETFLSTSSTPTSASSSSISLQSSSLLSTSSSSLSTITSAPSTTPSTATATSTSSSSSNTTIPPIVGTGHHLSHGALAGIIVAAALVLMALLLAVFLFLRDRRSRREAHASGGIIGDSSWGNEDTEWQIVNADSSGPSGPSGNSAPSGEGRNQTSVLGSGRSRQSGPPEAVLFDTELPEEEGDIENQLSRHSSIYIAIPTSNVPPVEPEQPPVWAPWRQGSVHSYRDLPAGDAADAMVDRPSPPMSPRSVDFSEGHNSDVEQDTLLHPAAVSAAAAGMGTSAYDPLQSSINDGFTRNRIVERAHEAVAQRRLRQRPGYVPGAAGFFQFVRNSWASSWRGPRTPGPSTDDLDAGFRPRSEKSQPGSKASSRSGRAASARQAASQRSRQTQRSQRSHPSSEKSEKSQLIEHSPEDDQNGTDESPPTPHSSQFPAPPPTHLEAHALVRQRSQSSDMMRQSSLDRQFRTMSSYSVGGGSISSGNTVYFDALDAPPLPSPLSPLLTQNRSQLSLRLVPPSQSFGRNYPHSPEVAGLDLAEFGELSSLGSELLPPRPLREFYSSSPRHSPRPPGSAVSQGSSLRSLAWQAGDALDDPPPEPSASIDRRGQIFHPPIPASPPPSYSERHPPPPGLEEYNTIQVPAFNRMGSFMSHETGAFGDALEEEPPSAGSQWRRITGADDDLPFGDRSVPPVLVTTHFRQTTQSSSIPRPTIASSQMASFHSGPLVVQSAANSPNGSRSSRAPSSIHAPPPSQFPPTRSSSRSNQTGSSHSSRASVARGARFMRGSTSANTFGQRGWRSPSPPLPLVSPVSPRESDSPLHVVESGLEMPRSPSPAASVGGASVRLVQQTPSRATSIHSFGVAL
ncbi:hypothetical protein DL93DRAFT_2080876 [Clavulina sp. PMI_390]|nr:hypothetical protein DL93DRAFT_2080876 [Clavulina sp. PMI_390]